MGSWAPRTVFLTVGSTRFEELVKAADTDNFAAALRSRGCMKLVMQVCSPVCVAYLVSGSLVVAIPDVSLAVL